MKTKRKAAVLALGLALFAPLAGARTEQTDWWDVDFNSPTPNGITFDEGAASRVQLTNATVEINGVAVTTQPYPSGLWSGVGENDDSRITGTTNSIVTNLLAGASEGDTFLTLDTNGDDLTWTPTNTAPAGKPVILVDADLYLVGSEEAPTGFDEDNGSPVQTAVFLKTWIDDETGLTTNTALFVYCHDESADNLKSWVQLAGPAIEDKTWHRVRVEINYKTTSTRDRPAVRVFVDEQPAPRADGSGEDLLVANNGMVVGGFQKIDSVSFRGTGAVDNFTGVVEETIEVPLDFTAEVYWDDELIPVDYTGAFPNKSQVALNVTVGENVTFGETPDDFYFEESDSDSPWHLTKIEVPDFNHPGTTNTYTYTYNAGGGNVRIEPDQEGDPATFAVNNRRKQTGDFTISVPTDGAEDNAVAAKLYFVSDGAYYAIAETVAGNTSTNKTIVKPTDFTGGATKALSWTFPETVGDYVLRTVRTSATASYDSANAAVTVSTNLTEALAADTVFVTATYVEGSYEGKTPIWIDMGAGSYVLGPFVAVVGDDDYRETLAAAIAAVQEDAATTTTVTLLASVDEDITIPAGKNVELDLNGCAITNVASDTISVYGTLVLTDSSENTNGIVASAIANKAAIVNYPGGNVVIEAGTIAVPDDATYYNIKNMGRMTIEEGAVVVSRVSTVSTLIANGWYGNATTDRGTTGSFGTAVLTIEGGTFDGGKNVVKNDDYGVLVIEGGTFANVSEVDAVIMNWHETTINGGEFTGATKVLVNGSYGKNTEDKGSMTVNGGTFRANGEQGNLFGYGYEGGKMSDALLEITGGTFYGHVAGLGDNDGTLGVAAISGGSFSEVVPQIYCADGFVPVKTADPSTGLFTVKPGAISVEGVAGAAYGAFADALADHGWAPTTYALSTNVAETVALTNANDKFRVRLNGFADGLVVTTTVANTPAVTYSVASEPDGTDAAVTVWRVTETTNRYDVVWIVEGNDPVTNAWDYGKTPEYPNGTPTKPATDEIEYQFTGWSPEVQAVTNNATYTATFSSNARKYEIVFENWDGTGLATNEVAWGETPVYAGASPTKPSNAQYDYTFEGAWTPAIVPVSGAATYRAAFTATAREYKIAYVLDWDGVYDEAGWPEGYEPVTNYTFQTDAFTVATPTNRAIPTPDKPAYVFAGWIGTGLDAATNELVLPPAGVLDNLCYTSVWKNVYTVELLHGAESYGTNYVVQGETFADPGEPEPKTPAAEGYAYRFDGWRKDSPTGAAASWPETIVANTQFYAVFTPTALVYQVSYDLGGGANDPANPATYEATDGEVRLADASKDYYDFDGWTNRAGTVRTAISIEDADENQTIAYVAKWTPVSYTITYVLGEGTNAVANPNAYTVETPTFTLAAPGREGNWKFAGWTEDGGATTNDSVTISQGSHGDRTFTALWEPDEPEHEGAKADNGFIILAPGDAANPMNQAPAFTAFDPAAGTASISAKMLNPGGAATAAVKALYVTALGSPTTNAVDATVSAIDTTAGTATVSFDMTDIQGSPASVFFVGFSNGEGVSD